VSLTPGFDQGMLAFDTHYLTPVIEQEDTDPFYTLRLSHSWYRTGYTDPFYTLRLSHSWYRTGDTDPFYTLRLSHSWYRTGDTEKFPLDIHCLSHGSVVEFIYIKY